MTNNALGMQTINEHISNMLFISDREKVNAYYRILKEICLCEGINDKSLRFAREESYYFDNKEAHIKAGG